MRIFSVIAAQSKLTATLSGVIERHLLKEMIVPEFDDYPKTGGFYPPFQQRNFDEGRLLASKGFDHMEVTETSELPKGRRLKKT